MLSEVMQKSVMLSLANGSVVEGFVLETDDEFIKLVEFDNSKLIVRKSDISYVKIYEGNRMPQIAAPDTAVAPSQVQDENQYVLPHQFAQQAPVQDPRGQFYVVRGRAQPQQDYAMGNPNTTGVAGPKLERQT
jgi:sRNA-binding regulator protein Hfq